MRDISRSSAERIVLPKSTLALDYILEKMNFAINGNHVYANSTERLLFFTDRLKNDPRCSSILKEAVLDEIFQIKPYLVFPLIIKQLGIA